MYERVFFAYPADDREFVENVLPYIKYRLRNCSVFYFESSSSFRENSNEVLERLKNADRFVVYVDSRDPVCMFLFGCASALCEKHIKDIGVDAISIGGHGYDVGRCGHFVHNVFVGADDMVQSIKVEESSREVRVSSENEKGDVS